MVSLTCSARAHDGVTLVTARLDGGGATQRVRLTNRLDGPVWPPRRQGIPEAGWDEECFETVVPADGTVAVGYASPAPPAETPLVVVDREVVAGDEPDEPVTAADALRSLGDPTPPRDAVPIPIDESARSGEPSRRSAPSDANDVSRPDTAAPDAVEAWFATVEERLALAERLAEAESLPEVTDALRQVGDLADAESLVEDVSADADALETVARRAGGLADRAAETDVPLTTLERIA